MNKSVKIVSAIAVVILIILWYFSGGKKDDGITTKAKYGKFTISVITSGELDAKNSTNIQGPAGLRSIGIYEDLKLNEIIPEGTEVDSGDYIASIDQTPILNKLKEVDANLEKLDAKISQSKLDSALTLRADRDNLINLKYALEELELELKNSEYESPVTKQKLRISIEKNKRQYKQALNNYKLKRKKEENTVRTAVIDYQKESSKKERFINVLKGFNITAPQSG
ncbi:MAG TPA: RND transporter, partial [Saprospiraceae bacterium]|nr:RND transporter [Saprospiraceae bacterium]